MARKTGLREAPGLEHIGVVTRSQGQDRNRFLAAVERVGPEIVKDLRENVLPALMKELGQHGETREWGQALERDDKKAIARGNKRTAQWSSRWRGVRRQLYEPAMDEQPSAAAALIVNWKRRWGLEATWVDEVVEWAARTGRFRYPAVYVPVDVPAEPLRLDAFDPTRETAEEFRRASHKTIEMHITQALETAGHLRDAEEIDEEHLSWLVRYQCLGEPAKNVRRRGTDNAAVYQAVKRAGGRLGLPRRKR